MTTYMGAVAAVATILAIVGYIIAFTVDANAINMALGCTLGAPFLWGFYVAMRYMDDTFDD